jgi:hypothetical protein
LGDVRGAFALLLAQVSQSSSVGRRVLDVVVPLARARTIVKVWRTTSGCLWRECMGYAPPAKQTITILRVKPSSRNKGLMGPWEGLARHHRRPPGHAMSALEEWAMGRDPSTSDCLLACATQVLRSQTPSRRERGWRYTLAQCAIPTKLFGEVRDARCLHVAGFVCTI